MTNLRSSTFLLPFLCAASTLLAQGEIDLRTTAKKGSSVWLDQTQKQEQLIDVSGQQIETTQTVHKILQVTVKEIDDKGNLLVETKIARIHGSMDIPQMGETTFDSAAPAGADEDDGMGGMMAMMTKSMLAGAGKSFTATVSGQGKVVKLGDDAAELLKGGGRTMGGPSLDESALKQMVQSAFGTLPEKPVAVGGKWEHVQNDTRGRGPIEHKMELTLAKADAETFEITATGTVAKPEAKGEKKADGAEGGEGEEAVARQVMDSMKVKNGKVVGAQKVSRADGFVVETSNTVSMDIEASSPMGEMQMTVKIALSTKRTTAEAAAPAKKAEATPDAGKQGEAKEAGK